MREHVSQRHLLRQNVIVKFEFWVKDRYGCIPRVTATRHCMIEKEFFSLQCYCCIAKKNNKINAITRFVVYILKPNAMSRPIAMWLENLTKRSITDVGDVDLFPFQTP